mmetsp:Transcript_34019/g.97253  ORF Transcript_34019/g.97253 Transcript_34019/m.97253 type:complete len:200 (-) Transcript_34019:236-835(-)
MATERCAHEADQPAGQQGVAPDLNEVVVDAKLAARRDKQLLPAVKQSLLRFATRGHGLCQCLGLEGLELHALEGQAFAVALSGGPEGQLVKRDNELRHGKTRQLLLQALPHLRAHRLETALVAVGLQVPGWQPLGQLEEAAELKGRRCHQAPAVVRQGPQLLHAAGARAKPANGRPDGRGGVYLGVEDDVVGVQLCAGR